MPPAELSALDAHIARQKEPLSRSATIRRLVEIGLKKNSTRGAEREAALAKTDAIVRAMGEANKAANDAKVERLRKERLARLATDRRTEAKMAKEKR